MKQGRSFEETAKLDGERAVETLHSLMSSRVLATISSKPDEATTNKASIALLREAQAAGAKLRSQSPIDRLSYRDSTTIKPAVDEQKVMGMNGSVDIQIKRVNDNGTVTTSSATTINKQAVDRKLDRLMETYKSVKLDTETMCSEEPPKPLSTPISRLGAYRSVDHARPPTLIGDYFSPRHETSHNLGSPLGFPNRNDPPRYQSSFNDPAQPSSTGRNREHVPIGNPLSNQATLPGYPGYIQSQAQDRLLGEGPNRAFPTVRTKSTASGT